MNDTKPKRKWSLLLLITALFLMLSPSQVKSQKNEQLRVLKDEKITKALSTSEDNSNDVVVQKTQVFHNKNGLKDDILIDGPLKVRIPLIPAGDSSRRRPQIPRDPGHSFQMIAAS